MTQKQLTLIIILLFVINYSKSCDTGFIGNNKNYNNIYSRK